MTLTFELDLGGIKMHQHAKYPSQMSLRSNLIAWTHTHTHRVDFSIWITKVVGGHYEITSWTVLSRSETCEHNVNGNVPTVIQWKLLNTKLVERDCAESSVLKRFVANTTGDETAA